jgi:diguanylate cyclase (GGDEF)-like protein
MKIFEKAISSRSWRYIAPALLLLVVVIVVACGWFFDIPLLKTMGIGTTQTALISTACFAIAALTLLQGSPLTTWAMRSIRICAGILILVISVTASIEAVNPEFLRTVFGAANPALMMSSVSILGFILSGLALIFLGASFQGSILKRFVQFVTVISWAIGAVGILSYVVNLDYLYVTSYSMRTPFPTALMFIMLALGLNALGNEAIWNIPTRSEVSPKHIYRTIDLVLIFIVATVSLIAFGLSQGRTEQLMSDQMTMLSQNRRSFFENALAAHVGKALQAASRPAIIVDVRKVSQHGSLAIDPNRELLDASAKSFLDFGFSALAYVDADDKTLASHGDFVKQPEQSIALEGKFESTLLWKNGYVLHTKLPMADKDGLAGYLISEQRMDELTAMHRDAIRTGQTGDMVVCGLRSDKQICFPIRWNAKAASYNAYVDGKALPITRAVKGETATEMTSDFRRQRVLAALGPIGTTGLGMASKMDLWELYLPIRKQFFQAMPFLAALVAGSIWLMRKKIEPLVKSLENSRVALKHTAQHDALTGLPNRMVFNDRIEQSMTRSLRTKNLMAVMFLDMDHFKQINDNFGHKVGDAALKWFSQQLRKGVRASDTVARLGGDEFVIILENLVCEEDAEKVAMKVQECVSETNNVLPVNSLQQISTSIGIAFFRGADIDSQELLHRADTALYQSKLAGRGSYMVLDESAHLRKAS